MESAFVREAVGPGDPGARPDRRPARQEGRGDWTALEGTRVTPIAPFTSCVPNTRCECKLTRPVAFGQAAARIRC